MTVESVANFGLSSRRRRELLELYHPACKEAITQRFSHQMPPIVGMTSRRYLPFHNLSLQVWFLARRSNLIIWEIIALEVASGKNPRHDRYRKPPFCPADEEPVRRGGRHLIAKMLCGCSGAGRLIK